MTTKVDPSTISYFTYRFDLQVEPPLSKGKITNQFVDLKTVKDEDVKLNEKGEMVIVTTEVTTLKAKHKPDEGVYGFAELVKGIEEVAALAKAQGSVLGGQCVAIGGDEEDEQGKPYRIRVSNNVVTLEEGKPAAIWPDGTTSPL